MKYIQNFRKKTEPQVLNMLADSSFPLIVGGGAENSNVEIYMFNNKESFDDTLNNSNGIEETFNITYKPYIINGYDQRMSLTTALGFFTKTFSAYNSGILSGTPYCYNYCKVSPLTYSSSNTDVATVDSNGVVTAIGNGTTLIKVNFAGNEKYRPHEAQYTLTIDIPIVVDPEPDYYLTYNGHKYVDLGLPSGRKWSVYNMGASAVNEEGDDTYYYANTTPSVSGNPAQEDIYVASADEYDRPETYSKYNDTDYKRTLDMSDDVARVNWGGNWKIPSDDDFNELTSNTTAELVTNYLGRGADGILFTSTTNGNTLFFPLSDNGEWGRVKLMTNKLYAEDCPAIWMWGRWWDGNPNETCTYDEEAMRWYTYNIRPVF